MGAASTTYDKRLLKFLGPWRGIVIYQTLLSLSRMRLRVRVYFVKGLGTRLDFDRRQTESVTPNSPTRRTIDCERIWMQRGKASFSSNCRAFLQCRTAKTASPVHAHHDQKAGAIYVTWLLQSCNLIGLAGIPATGNKSF